MIVGQSRLTLILPSLLESRSVDSSSLCPVLTKLKARAKPLKVSVNNFEQAVLEAFSQNSGDLADIPGAQCAYLSDFNESAPTDCVQADPVHLRVERDNAQLFSAETLEISKEQEERLVLDLNRHFESDGARYLLDAEIVGI